MCCRHAAGSRLLRRRQQRPLLARQIEANARATRRGGCRCARSRPTAARSRRFARGRDRFPLPVGLVVKKGSKARRKDLRLHAEARIRHLDLDVIGGPLGRDRPGPHPSAIRGGDAQRSAFRHGVPRIDREIEQRALELGRIADDVPAALPPLADRASTSEPSVRRSISSRPRISRRGSMRRGSSVCRRAKASIRLMRTGSRAGGFANRRDRRRRSHCRAHAPTCRSMTPTDPEMTCSTLLKS